MTQSIQKAARHRPPVACNLIALHLGIQKHSENGKLTGVAFWEIRRGPTSKVRTLKIIFIRVGWPRDETLNSTCGKWKKEGKIVANRFRTTQQKSASEIGIEISGIQYTIYNIQPIQYPVPSTHRHLGIVIAPTC